MKWDNVQITGNDNKVYTGKGASEFVTRHCQPIQIRTTDDGLIEVYAGAVGATKNDKEVRKYLFLRLLDKAKSLKITTGDESQRVTLPLARAIKNVFNLIPTKLKVEFIHKDSSPRRYLEDSNITVTALLEGSNAPLTKAAEKGIADFGSVVPGAYKITVDYPESDECKYDWSDEKRDVQVKSGSESIVEFEVEPLYQQVQFIAHCLTTIGHQIFVPSVEDADKVEVTDTNGRTEFKFKDKPAPDWAWGELPSDVRDKALRDILPGKKNAIKMRKNSATNNFWTLADIRGLYEDKIELGAKMGDAPEKYEFTFKKKDEGLYTVNQLTGDWKSKYHGDVDDIKDIEARVRFVGDTLEKAYAQSNREATVLKVFMIPECFFQGLYGTYISDDAAELVGKLQNLVKDKKWKDWIFSFGTVNRVFLGLQPKSVTGGEKNKTIYEMANHAPVMRGGLEKFDFSGDDSTRLIQKLLNSLELAGEDDLIKAPKITELVRKKEELIKAKEESVKLGKLEKKELENETEKIDGIEIKRIRPQSVNEEVQFEATEYDEQVARLLEKLLEDNSTNSTGLRGDAKEDEIKVQIKKIGIAQAVRQIRTTKEADIFSVWRERLKLYEKKLDAAQELNWKERLEKAETLQDEEKLKEQKKIEEEKKSKKPLHLEFEQSEKESMSLEDYVFACPRKAGPLFKNLAEARKVKACKRLVFGLEICADHGDWRILNINTGSNQIDVDIQLVPSAGQKPRYFATRKNGFVFNCDGWNQQPNGGRIIETHLDGPSPFIKGIKQTSPIYPHSAAVKRETDEIDVGAKKCLEPEKTATPSEELSKIIFGYGAGELHFYPLQDLPK
jgi:hypothetical protein